MATIELYLIRHGIAVERGERYPDDRKRPLTAEGIARLKKEAKALDSLGVSFDRILSSPLIRTRQTADVFSNTLRTKPRVALSEALSPAGTPAAVLEELERHARNGSIALVGHEPNLGELAAHLIGARRALPFKKGAICRIDVESLSSPEPGLLRWFMPPRLLRRLSQQS
jgi:phosphohistidine phosphatase